MNSKSGFVIIKVPNLPFMSDKSFFDVSRRVFNLLLVLGVILGLFWVFRIYEIWNSVSGNYAREITVEAQGNAYVVPDTAVIQLGVTTDGEDSATVVDENTETMNAVLAAIKALGIEESKIKTIDYYLSPKYEYDDEGNYAENGYTLSQSVEVRLTDFELIGQVISAGSDAGANSIGSVSFELENPETAKAEAREEAVNRAKEKADQIAEASGLNLGKMVNYYEYSSDGYYPVYDMSYSEAVGKGGEAPEIAPGEQEVNLTVSLTYQIR